MCLKLTKDSARLKKNLRRRKRPIKVYKFLTINQISPWYNQKYSSTDINKSSRSKINLNIDEIEYGQVFLGLHFYLENPRKAYLYPYQCPYQYLCPHRCPYPCPRPRKPFTKSCLIRIFECEIDPKDVVAVGKFDNHDCIVATKCGPVKEI